MKKGQIIGSVIKYLLIALVVIIIQFMFFKFYTSIKDSQCKTEMAKFEFDLSDYAKKLEFGSVHEQKYTVPCDADKLYLVDLDKDIHEEAFKDMPLIKDSVYSNAKKNVFVVKDGKIISSFYSADLQFSYPYYSCLLPRAGKISFFPERRGSTVKITPGCTQAECTVFPSNVSEEKAQFILQEFIDFGCPECPSQFGKDVEFQRFKNTLDVVNIYRRVKFCPETGITTVEIVIEPKDDATLKNFRFMEYIPKECVSDLQDYLVSITDTDDINVYIKDDPLIMWQFDEVSEEAKIEYDLEKKLSEDCVKIIQGMAVAELIVGDDTVSGPLEITGLPSEITFDEGKDYTEVEYDVDYLIPESYTAYTRNKLDWTFSGNDNVDVGTSWGKLRVESDSDWYGTETVTFTVTAPDGETASASMDITVINVNDPPSWNFEDITMDEDTSFTVNLGEKSDDVDLVDVLTYTATGSDNIDVTLVGNVATIRPHDDYYTPSGSILNPFPAEKIKFTASDSEFSVDEEVKVTVENVNDPPSIAYNIKDQSFPGDPSDTHEVDLEGIDLADVGQDIDDSSLSYSIISQSDSSLVDCAVTGMFTKKIECEVQENEDGYSEVTLQVSDGEYTDTDDFKVNVYHMAECGDLDCEGGEDCNNCPDDCGVCGENTYTFNGPHKVQCQQIMWGRCGYSCYDHFGTGWYPTGRDDCCGLDIFGCIGDEKPECKKEWWTSCGTTVSCGTGTKIDEETCPYCGDGTCDSGENCGNCADDCGCSSGQVCYNNACCTISSWTPATSTKCSGTSFTQTSNCGTTRTATGTKACSASLSASYSVNNKQTSGGSTYYYYTLTIKETNGVGVTFNSRKKCTQKTPPSNCPVKTDISTYLGTNYVSGKGTIIAPTTLTYFYTTASSDILYETIWGTDDNGNSVSVYYEIIHPS